jgi:hypothetical protein
MVNVCVSCSLPHKFARALQPDPLLYIPLAACPTTASAYSVPLICMCSAVCPTNLHLCCCLSHYCACILWFVPLMCMSPAVQLIFMYTVVDAI